jgi:hypothetical protein
MATFGAYYRDAAGFQKRRVCVRTRRFNVPRQ